MRVLIALDWSEQAFAGVREVSQLYDLQEVVLVHGIDLGMFQYPLVAEVSNMQGYDEFRQAMEKAGRQLLDHTTTMLPSEGVTITRVCEFAKPASLILDKARETGADLIVMGARGRGRVGELMLGSVSHRVALHADCSTLIVKDHSGPLKRVVVAVEGHEDGARLKSWLLAHPFKSAVDLTIVSVVRPIPATDPFSLFPLQDWTDVAMRAAEDLVKSLAAAVMDHQYTVGTLAMVGDPTDILTERAKSADLLVIGSHGRKGLERFLLGSISHALLHHVPCPVLIVR
ncbi:MAG: Universal stress protein [Nitrospirae bacterium]|nr:MAG: putative universal stress protein [Nitrospira sp. OLB3]MBV6471294.1 Universal stress protein [Nitrospirota bacterium]MCE7966606.1 universal stress protein [Nitrospira sp. NTP2]MCK6492018.1 universal stress protein [Nitrospira sp.]MEB2338849.1 universal stress protein [Nitrospirales bacterium]